LGLYLALWFWIGLFLDYGFFKLFTWDWVQILPWGFRAGVLVVLVAGLLAAVATKVVTRLFKEFRDAALALVLERRFPQLLGDRTDFHEVACIWFERNILLEDTIWPRKAHLELVGFPAGGEIRIGQGSTPPPLRVRALKYVIAGAPTAGTADAYRTWLQTKG